MELFAKIVNGFQNASAFTEFLFLIPSCFHKFRYQSKFKYNKKFNAKEIFLLYFFSLLLQVGVCTKDLVIHNLFSILIFSQYISYKCSKFRDRCLTGVIYRLTESVKFFIPAGFVNCFRWWGNIINPVMVAQKKITCRQTGAKCSRNKSQLVLKVH